MKKTNFNLEIRSQQFSLRGELKLDFDVKCRYALNTKSLNARITSNNRIAVCVGAYHSGDTHRANV